MTFEIELKVETLGGEVGAVVDISIGASATEKEREKSILLCNAIEMVRYLPMRSGTDEVPPKKKKNQRPDVLGILEKRRVLSDHRWEIVVCDDRRDMGDDALE